MEEFFVSFYFFCLEGILKQSTGSVIIFIEIHGVTGIEMVHKFCNAIFCDLPEEEVIMVRHEAIAKNIDFIFQG